MSVFRDLRAWHGLPHDEFLDQLRGAAINSGASPAIIDALDALRGPDEILDHPEVVEAIDDARRGGALDMRGDAVTALEAALPAVGLTRAEIKKILAIVEKLRPS